MEGKEDGNRKSLIWKRYRLSWTGCWIDCTWVRDCGLWKQGRFRGPSRKAKWEPRWNNHSHQIKTEYIVFFGSITHRRQMKRQHVFCFSGCGYHSHKKAILKLFLFYGKRSHCRQMGNILLFILFHRKGKIVLFFVPDCFVKVGLNWDQGQGELWVRNLKLCKVSIDWFEQTHTKVGWKTWFK